MPVTFLTFAVCTAALIAVPLTSGWWSKEAILDKAWEHSPLLFLIAAFTALLTAFYMTRLCIVTFFGKARDEHGAGHAHEVPGLMRIPLIVLAVLAAVAGFGLAGAAFGEGYSKFFHVHFGVPAIVSLLTLVLGVFGAYKLYWGRDTEPLNIKLFANKFYFDELYAKIVAICQDAVATVSRVLDSLFIDGLGVGGAKSIANNAGQALRRIQSGNLQGYAFLFGLGVLIIVFLALAK
jgi:NADH-quinone oxidoreductase subunit L